jgi:uncharacterized protein YbjQ (UPF0145 family)
MLITTSFEFPGYEIVALQGEVFGLTVRARNIGAGMMASLRSIGGGEIPEFTKLLTQSRNEAMARMVGEAQVRGANAIIGMRFDSGAIGDWSEICAYGTAVSIRPMSSVARQQYEAMVRAGQMPHQQAYAPRVSEWDSPPPPPQQPSPPAYPPPPPGDGGQQ